MAPRRLLVFCDGTWQDGINNKTPLTNVAVLARCLKQTDPTTRIPSAETRSTDGWSINTENEDEYTQVVYYDGGIGNVTSTSAQVVDAAIGRGISSKIRNAYSFLSHNYDFQNKQEMEIILVGFSRGAFAAQCLASFISDVGLLEPRSLYLNLRPVFKLWSHRNIKSAEEKLVQLLEEWKKLREPITHKVSINICALWDTVSALGGPAQIPPRRFSFVGKKVPSCVKNAFQALALHEKRWTYKPCVWESAEPGPELEQDSRREVSQCWFIGSHGDVGGQGDPALGAVTLLWMIGKLSQYGVKFDEQELRDYLENKRIFWDYMVCKLFRYVKPNKGTLNTQHLGKVTRSQWLWFLLGWKSRATYLSRSALNQEIHFTVRLRLSEGWNDCPALRSWKTDLITSDSVHWRSPRSNVVLKEGNLRKKKKEHALLSRYSGDVNWEKAGVTAKEAVHGPAYVIPRQSGPGLFPEFLKARMLFDRNQLAPTLMYPSPSRKPVAHSSGSVD